MPDILANITVVDLSQNVAGPICTQLLGDFGAEVIKVERPGTGDDSRTWTRHTWNGTSTFFLGGNRNKRSICVDFGKPAGLEVIRKLAARADVFIHSVRPGKLESRGLGWAELHAHNPELVYCAISAFGGKGPRAADPGYDALLQAFSGVMSVTGHADRPPARVGVSILDISSGIWAFNGILAALYRRKDTGIGANVEVSLMETGVNWMTMFLMHYMATGDVGQRTGDMTLFSAPYEAFDTKDGSVLIVASNDRLFANVCRALGTPELANDARFRTNALRIREPNRSELHAILEARTSTLTSDACVEVMRQAGAPCSTINTVDAVCRDPQVDAMRMIRPFPTAENPDLKVVDIPVSIDGVKASLRRPPPGLGQHTNEVLVETGYSSADIEKLRSDKVVA